MPEITESIESPVPPAIAPVSPLNTDPDLLAKIYERMTPTGREAFRSRPIFGFRTLSFTVDGSQCAPGAFEDAEGNPIDFTLTMRALDPEKEIELMEQGFGGALPIAMTKAMLHRVNGTLVSSQQREFLWNALGSKGRGLCTYAYQQLAGTSQAALGKFHASSSIGTE